MNRLKPVRFRGFAIVAKLVLKEVYKDPQARHAELYTSRLPICATLAVFLTYDPGFENREMTAPFAVSRYVSIFPTLPEALKENKGLFAFAISLIVYLAYQNATL